MIKSAIALGLLLGFLAILGPATSNGQDRVTLHSIQMHRGQPKVFCLNFRSGPSRSTAEPCDLRYGSLYVGDDHDWFQSSGAMGHRSVIKDLGSLNWDQTLTVPVVTPLPKPQPGEQRKITVDVSGADVADGAPGRDGVDGDGVLRPRTLETVDSLRARPARPKHDGKPRVDSIFAKAIVGHMYVIHVVHDTDDFYVVFRVEEVERGSSCTVSWRFVPDPALSVVQTNN